MELATADYAILAVTAVAAVNARVGVDVESVGRDLSEEFTTGVFTPEELELAAQAANAVLVSFIRCSFACLLPSPKNMASHYTTARRKTPPVICRGWWNRLGGA